jgi:hypothetical protein
LKPYWGDWGVATSTGDHRSAATNTIKEERKMKTYWIDECIVTREGKLLPKGFELHIGETARIVVPSDVPGDKESLYEEEIQLSQEIFAAAYENGMPVHIKDGEFIGEEKAMREDRWT